MTPSIYLRVVSKHTILDYNFLLTMLIVDKISSQITRPTINSNFSSAVTKNWASLTVFGSSVQVLSTSFKADIICGTWYLIGCTLFIRLSQWISDKGLTVNLSTLSVKIFHLLVERANKQYICRKYPVEF